MLARPYPLNARLKPRAAQNGVVLVIALIVLVAMTLAGIALVRSVDTTNVIAGNLSFQQAATHANDKGIEAAISCLITANNTNSTLLHADYPTCAYHAAQLTPTGNWDQFWNTATGDVPAKAFDPDAGGNTVSYVVHRLCGAVGDPTLPATGCSFVPGCDGQTGGAGCIRYSQVYYRITSQVRGPHNTVSYVQSIIAM